VSALADDAGAVGSGWGLAGLFGSGLAGEHLGDFEEAHAGFKESGLDEAGLGGGEVACGFFGDEGKHVDGLTSAEEIDLWGLAGFGAAAELEDGLHVDGLDEPLEAHVGHGFHAGVGGADGGVEAVDGGGVGTLGLLGLLGGGGWWSFRVGVGFADGLGTGSSDGLVGNRLGAGELGRGLVLVGRRSGGLEGFRTRGLGLGRWSVRADVAFGGELATVVDYEFFDFCHGCLDVIGCLMRVVRFLLVAAGGGGRLDEKVWIRVSGCEFRVTSFLGWWCRRGRLGVG